MRARFRFGLFVVVVALSAFAGCAGRGTSTLPAASTASPAGAAAAASTAAPAGPAPTGPAPTGSAPTGPVPTGPAPSATGPARSAQAVNPTPSPNYLGYVSYFWGDKTLWAINCDAPFYFPPNTCLAIHATNATQLGGPALAVHDFVSISADPATSGPNGLTVLTYTTSLTPFPGSPVWKGYTGPTPAPTPTASASPNPTPTPTASPVPTATPIATATPVATPTPVATATPTGPATPPSTNYLGYVSYYWGDLTKFAINCDAPTYFPPNTCLAVNAGAATKYGSGPALAVGDFIAIYANPATSGKAGLIAITYATSLTPFAGSPLPKGYTGPTPPPTPTPTANPNPTPTPVPTATPTSSPTGSSSMVDWPTFGYDNARTGESPDTTITTSNVSTLKIGWYHHLNSTGEFNLQTQPIVATGVIVGGTSHNVVYVGGGSGNVYAFDAFTGTQLWKTNVGQGFYNCGTSGPYGVSGTFALDKANGVIYVPDGLHRIHALSLGTGADLWHVDAVAGGTDDGTTGNLHAFIHTGLTLVGTKLYGGTGSTCDITPWRGRVFEIDVTSRALVNTFLTTYNSSPSGQPKGRYGGGGVWGWGGASSDGNAVYFGAGNTDTAGQPSGFDNPAHEWSGFGEHVVSLTTDLALLDSHWPGVTSNPSNAVDLDLSGTPVLFQPGGCPPLLALQGKQGYLLIYNRSSLHSGPIASFQFSRSSDASHNIGLPAYSGQTGLLYESLPENYSSYGAGLAILAPANGCSTFTVTTQQAFGVNSESYGDANPRGSPTIANGIAFIGTPNGVLWARKASDATALWNSTVLWGASGGSDEIRPGPTVTGGWVYVVTMESSSIYALHVSGAATSSALRQATSNAGPSTGPLPAPPVYYRPPARRKDPFGRTQSPN